MALSRRLGLFACAAIVTGACGDDGSGDSDGATSQEAGPGSGESMSTSADTSTSTTTAGSQDSSTSSSTTSDETSTGGGPPGGYEGFGAITMGADSCPDTPDEIHVTSLDDDGPGTLRDALTDGCRRIVFDLGGTITLADTLNIRYPYITVDGQTAPDPGITIVQPGLVGTTIEARASTGPAHDIIINNLRMDGEALDHENEGDIWGLDGQDAPVYAIIIDHVTGIAATDGVFDIYGDVKDVTLSWNLVLDTVTALHLSTGDIGQTRERVSIHHNVFARNNERQVRLRHETLDIDYVNNVIYGWGWFEAGAAGLHLAYDDGEVNPSMNVINNLFHQVRGTNGSDDDAIRFEQGVDVNAVYFDGNLVPPGESDNVSTGAALPIPAAAQVTTYAASELSDDVVPHVGTHHPTTDEMTLLDEIAAAVAP